MINRFLYENSVSLNGYLIIPFVMGVVEGISIYSYMLLSELGHKGKFHQGENPAKLHSTCLEGILKIAQEHLETCSDIHPSDDYFQNRYTYRDHLIIVHSQGNQYFYDHYPPDQIKNIAAPRLFSSEQACLTWIKQGLERNYF